MNSFINLLIENQFNFKQKHGNKLLVNYLIFLVIGSLSQTIFLFYNLQMNYFEAFFKTIVKLPNVFCQNCHALNLHLQYVVLWYYTNKCRTQKASLNQLESSNKNNPNTVTINSKNAIFKLNIPEIDML